MNERTQTFSHGLSLLFPGERRPDAEAIVSLFEAGEHSGIPARVSHRPANDHGWVEILASGLTFDLTGLSPAPAQAQDEVRHVYGYDHPCAVSGFAAVSLLPTNNISAGAALPPVIRTMLGVAANLALHLDVSAVLWRPAGIVIEPRYFARTVMNWLAGGPFPALGLTALVPGPDGSVTSQGLSYFVGQEVQIEGVPDEAPADAIKLAIRVVDFLVHNGPLREAGPIGSGLTAEPSQFGKLILVWRGQ